MIPIQTGPSNSGISASIRNSNRGRADLVPGYSLESRIEIDLAPRVQDFTCLIDQYGLGCNFAGKEGKSRN